MTEVLVSHRKRRLLETYNGSHAVVDDVGAWARSSFPTVHPVLAAFSAVANGKT